MPSILNEYDIKKMALFAVFVLAVIGLIYWLSMPYKTPFTMPVIPTTMPSEGTPAPTDCSKLELPEKDVCYGNEAILTSNVISCNKIQDQNLQDSCILGIALQKQEVSLCDKISSPETGDRCYFQASQQTNDPEPCKKITSAGASDACIISAISAKPNSSYSQELCLALRTLPQKNLCFYTLAMQEKNQNPCSFITDDNQLKDACIKLTEAIQ